MSVVVPACGSSSCVARALAGLRGRACPGFRVIVIGSNSGSGASDILERCKLARSQLVVVGGRGNNISSTEGANVHGTRKRFVYFVSSSSRVSPGCLLGVCSERRRAKKSTVCYKLCNRRVGGNIACSPVGASFGRKSLLFSFFCGGIEFRVKYLFVEGRLLRSGGLFFSRSLQLKRSLSFVCQLLVAYSVCTIPCCVCGRGCERGSLVGSYEAVARCQRRSFTRREVCSSIVRLCGNGQGRRVRALLDGGEACRGAHCL